MLEKIPDLMRTYHFFLFICLVISNSANAQSFTRGHYQAKDSTFHRGRIAFQIGQDDFLFRGDPQSKAQKLKPENVLGFVWGVDSFAVLEDRFVRVLIDEGPIHLYQYTKFSERTGTKNIMGDKQPGYVKFVHTYILERSAKGRRIEAEQKEKKFIKQMSDFFSDAPQLVARIENKEFGAGDIRRLVKLYNEEFAP